MHRMPRVLLVPVIATLCTSLSLVIDCVSSPPPSSMGTRAPRDRLDLRDRRDSGLPHDTTARDASNATLPITELPASTGHTLALFWSGDGGWAELTDQVARELAARGVAVIGINSRKWLGSDPRTPAEAARDSETLLRRYLAQWNKERVLLVGFSRGAGFLPFIVNRLPADLKSRVDLVALMGIEHASSFEFHLSDLVMSKPRPTDLPALPEVARAQGVRWFCLYGTTEHDTICPAMDERTTTIVARRGDHHFDRNYAGIAGDIIAAVSR